MARVMLPLAACVNAACLKIRLIILAIDMRVVDIDVAIDIDVDVAATPITAAPGVTPRGADGHTRGK
jgi:hypothetical protein